MIEFDSQLKYQFVVFLTGLDVGSDARIPARELSAQSPHGKNWGLKFRKPPTVEKILEVQAAPLGAVPLDRFVWQASAGLWRLEVTAARIDLTFDPLGYADAREGEGETVPSLPEIVKRVTGPLTRSVAQLGAETHRVALVVTGGCGDGRVCAPHTIAQHFFNERYAASPQTRDVQARVNTRDAWELGHLDEEGKPRPVVANRLETAIADMIGNLTWSWDANVAPDETRGPLSASVIEQFFEKACEWIEASRAQVEPVHHD